MKVIYRSDTDEDHRSLEQYVSQGRFHGGVSPVKQDHLSRLEDYKAFFAKVGDRFGMSSSDMCQYQSGGEELVLGTRYDDVFGYRIVSEIVERLWNEQGVRPGRAKDVPFVACFDLGTFEAWAERTFCSDRPVVAVNSGSLMYCYLLAKAFVSALPLVEDGDGSVGRQRFATALNAELVRNGLENNPGRATPFRDLMIAVGSTGHVSNAPQVWLDWSRQSMSSTLAYLMEYFLVSHEIAHVILGQLGGETGHAIDLLKVLGLPESHLCEVSADSLALMFTMSAACRDLGDSCVGFLAALLLIVGLDVILMSRVAFGQGDLTSALKEQERTHPSGDTRINLLGMFMERFAFPSDVQGYHECGIELVEIVGDLVEFVADDVSAESDRIKGRNESSRQAGG